MSFNWSDYLDLAKRLHSQALISNEESEKRTAMSRAYYAAAMLSRAFLQGKGWTIPTLDTHNEIIERFENNPNLDHQTLARRLIRLRGMRNAADYDGQIKNIDNACKGSIILAEKIIKQLKSL